MSKAIITHQNIAPSVATENSRASQSWIGKYLSNVRLVFFVYLVVLIAGLIALFNLPREMMPSIDLPMVIVSTTLVGANASDVEDLLTTPIEDQLHNVKGIDTINSSSMDNTSLIVVQFEEKFTADYAVDAIQKSLDNLTLPTDAQKPYIAKVDFDETPIWTFALTGEDRVGLNLLAQEIQEKLEQQTEIDRVEINGLAEREIVVFIDSAKMAELGLQPAVLTQLVSAASSSLPAGSVTADNLSYSVSLDKSLTDLDALRKLPLFINNHLYHLADIAEIYEQEVPGTSSSYQTGVNNDIAEVVTLNVYKVAGAPIDVNAKLARQIAEDILADHPQFYLRNIMDYGEEIGQTFQDLALNIVETFILVFLVMLVFLGVREAFISSVSIPVVMLLTIALMSAFDLSLNFISLFALLLVLGMLVDNAIVVTTALSRAAKKPGITPLAAGVAVWREYFVALISTNLTTVWAFLPLVIMTGIMGQFIRPISIVVTIAILGSAVVAFFMTLPLGVFILNWHLPTRLKKLLLVLLVLTLVALPVIFLPKNWLLFIIIPLVVFILYLSARMLMATLKSRKSAAINHSAKVNPFTQQWRNLTTKLQAGFVSTAKIERGYQNIITKILSNARSTRLLMVSIIVVTIFSFTLLATGLVKSEFFPKEKAETLEIEFSLPVGSNQDYAQEVALTLLPQLQSLPDINYVTAQTGRGSNSTLMSGGSSSNKILFTLNLVEEKAQTLGSIKLAEKIRQDLANNQFGTAQVVESSDFSAMGADLQLSVAGDDLAILATQANLIQDWLASQPGVTDINSTLADTSKKIVFEPNQEVLLENGLSAPSLGVWLRSTLSGWSLGTLKETGEDEKDITLRQYRSEPDISALNQINIPVNSLGYLPLTNFGQFVSRSSNATITHQDYRRLVTVSATVTDGYSATTINKDLQTFVQNQLDLPAGYETVTGGMMEANNESIKTIELAMLIASILILMTLVIQLHSFRKAFIVMSVIPVAISGVFIIFALTGISLTMPALIGVLALFGIVVNNSILIVERINQNLAAGQQFLPALIDGSTSRLQPILLTSLTTIIGLIPITLSDPMWQGLGGSIIAGLTFSGVLLLFYIPALYQLMFSPDKLAAKEKSWHNFWKKLDS